MPITGVRVGGSGTFDLVFSPANATLPSGDIPTWSLATPDANITLAPSADGLTCVVSVAAAATTTSFVLNASVPIPGGAALTPTATVPILPPLPTAAAIDQTS